jgi:hypothetical protein
MSALEWASYHKDTVALYGSYAINAYTHRLSRRPTNDVDIAVCVATIHDFFRYCASMLSYVSDRMGDTAGMLSSRYSEAENSSIVKRPITFIISCLSTRIIDMSFMEADIIRDGPLAVVPWDSVGMCSVDGAMPCFQVRVISISRLVQKCVSVCRDPTNFRREREIFEFDRIRMLAEKRLFYKKPADPLSDKPAAPSPPSSPAPPETFATDDAASTSSLPSVSTLGASLEDCPVPMPRTVLDAAQCEARVSVTAPAPRPALRAQRNVAACTVASSTAADAKQVAAAARASCERLHEEYRILSQAMDELSEKCRRESALSRQFVDAASKKCAAALGAADRIAEDALDAIGDALRAIDTKCAAGHLRRLMCQIACTGCFFGSHDIVREIDAMPSPTSLTDAISVAVGACVKCIVDCGAPAHASADDDARRIPAYASALPLEHAIERIARRARSPPLGAFIDAGSISALEDALVAQSLITPGVVTRPARTGGLPADNAWALLRMVCCAISCAIDAGLARCGANLTAAAARLRLVARQNDDARRALSRTATALAAAATTQIPKKKQTVKK